MGGGGGSAAPRPETRAGVDLESQTGDGRLSPRDRAPVSGAGVGNRPAIIGRPIPLRVGGLHGQRLERGAAAFPKGPPTQSGRSACGALSGTYGREPWGSL